MSYLDFRIFKDLLVDDSGNRAVRCIGDWKAMSDGNMGIVSDVTVGLFTWYEYWYEYGEELVLIHGTE
jgi:hypothetical protein